MISFESDYDNGVQPEILKRFVETNSEKHPDMDLMLFARVLKQK